MPARPVNIFYSWQSDLPNRSNRGLIEDALRRAADSVRVQKASTGTPIEFVAAVDRDTKGRLGSPDIAATIFAKIRECDIFIADVSIINQPASGLMTLLGSALVELPPLNRTT